MGLRRVAAPAGRPVSEQALARHLNLADCDVEAKLVAESLAEGAADYVENYIRRALVTQTWEQTLTRWRSCIVLARPPFQELLAFQVWRDVGNGPEWVDVDADVYRLVYSGDCMTLALAEGKCWPMAEAGHPLPIRVEYVAGYGDDHTAIPKPIGIAICMLAAHWFVSREPVVVGSTASEIPWTVQRLLDQHKVYINPQTNWIDHDQTDSTRRIEAPNPYSVSESIGLR